MSINSQSVLSILSKSIFSKMMIPTNVGNPNKRLRLKPTVDNTHQIPCLAPKVIYRDFIKNSLNITKIDPFLGDYMFSLLQQKKQHLNQQLESVNKLSNKISRQRRVFSKSLQQSPRLIVLNVSYRRSIRKIQSKFQHYFRLLYFLTKLLRMSQDMQSSLTIRSMAQTKLIRLMSNSSDFVDKNLNIRDNYQSRQLKQLTQDMEFEGLTQKDQKWVYQIVKRITQKKVNKNNTKIINQIDYLQNNDAQSYQSSNKIYIKNNTQQSDKKTLNQNDIKQEIDKTQHKQIMNSRFQKVLNRQFQKVMNSQQQIIQLLSPQMQKLGLKKHQLSQIQKQKLRVNRMITDIIKQKCQDKKNVNISITTNTSLTILMIYSKLLISQNIKPQQKKQQLLEVNKQKLKKQFYRSYKKLFRLQTTQGENQQNQQDQKPTSKYRMIEDLVQDHQIIYQFVRIAKVIIV